MDLQVLPASWRRPTDALASKSTVCRTGQAGPRVVLCHHNHFVREVIEAGRSFQDVLDSMSDPVGKFNGNPTVERIQVIMEEENTANCQM